MTTAVAESPDFAGEAAAGTDRWTDGYGWMDGQRKEIARVIEAGERFHGLDLKGLDEELAGLMSDLRTTFISHVENIVERLARIQATPDFDHALFVDVGTFRARLSSHLRQNISLLDCCDELLGWALPSGLRRAAARLAEEAYSDEAGPDRVLLTERFEARLKAECGYCFEHVAAVTLRGATTGPDGRLDRRAGLVPDHRTFPPEVAQVVNARIDDPADHLPILNEGCIAAAPSATEDRKAAGETRPGGAASGG